jgi:hypothetical protein
MAFAEAFQAADDGEQCPARRVDACGPGHVLLLVPPFAAGGL